MAAADNLPGSSPAAGTPAPHVGVLVLDKPIGWSSMRAVAWVRRRAGGARTGHAGTLDPLATGVLVLALGKATKAIPQLMGTRKTYRTVIDLSAVTATDDAEAVPEPVAVAAPPDRPALLAALEAFRGRILQRPPDFSAIKVAGRRAYALARRGEAVAVEPREVVAHAVELEGYDWPLATLRLETGKGFYVRSLARDLGTALGTGGYCRSIRRLAVGPFSIEEACDVASLGEAIAPETLVPLETALARVAAAE